MGHNETEIPKPPKSLWPVFLWSGVGLALFLIASKALLSFSGPVQPEDAERALQRKKAYEDLMAENETKLNSFAWVDREKNSVQIPIQIAISLAKERLSSKVPVVWQPPAESLPLPTPGSTTFANPNEKVNEELPGNELIPNMDSSDPTNDKSSSSATILISEPENPDSSKGPDQLAPQDGQDTENSPSTKPPNGNL